MGYGDATKGPAVHRHVGPLIIANRNTPILIRFRNRLPANSIIPLDNSIPGADTGQTDNRAAVHLHGGFIPWVSDGGPFDWFTPNGTHGSSFLNNSVYNPANDPAYIPGTSPGPAQAGEAFYYYPNQESYRLMWYHDHALGTTRTNAYAGIAAGYLVYDEALQTILERDKVIPPLARTIPLVLQDKIFKQRPDQWGAAGDLWYPSVYDPLRWELLLTNPATGTPYTPPPIPSCVPEFFADTLLMNGVVYPYLEVERDQYRFLMLNACNARFVNLQLFYADSTGKEPDLSKPGPPIFQIGTEAGFLPAPVIQNNYTPIGFDSGGGSTNGNAINYNLLMAPAERADFIIDFSQVPAGSKLILYSDAPSPFPGGDPLNDYYPKSGNPTLTKPGYGPNTRTLLQFIVKPGSGTLYSPPSSLPMEAAPLFTNVTPGLLPDGYSLEAHNVYDITLNEDFDEYGRLTQRIGTTEISTTIGPPATYSKGYTEPNDPPTETVTEGETWIWRIFNLTGDVHPLHFHLVNVQVLWRAAFDSATPDFTSLGVARPPDPNEMGWKETVRMNPGEVIAVAMKFDLPTLPSGLQIPFSPRLQSGYADYSVDAYEYVWHCHILEHEEHDMMRPVVVMPKSTPV